MTRRPWMIVPALGAATAFGGAPVAQRDSLPGLVSAGEYAEARPGAFRRPLPQTGGVYSAGPFPLATPDLAPSDGRELVQSFCSTCHSLRYITMQPPLPPAQWEATVKKMIDVHGAEIPQPIAWRIIAYLQANYGGR